MDVRPWTRTLLRKSEQMARQGNEAGAICPKDDLG